ncbi:FAD-dependent oxidoreductase [Paenalcaligenes hominis]|uniref:FAD-dependent oxidoreductase n=1 Tax=Paenalcaligenes hominis TaxID=643674 RepID=UPI003525C717
MTQTSSSVSEWDAEYDVLVIGSGAAGLSTAITASIEGAKSLVIEKTAYIGGSTAISGGAIWAPLHAQSAQAGHLDSLGNVKKYLDQVVGSAGKAETMACFLKYASQMVDYFSEHDVLHLVARTYAPDYYPDLEGALLGGRSFDPVVFDGKKLGKKYLKELRNPLSEFMVLGGMMVNVTDAKNLLAATRSFSAWKASMKLLIRYAQDRLMGYHRGTRLLLGNAVAGQLFHSLLQRAIPYWLNTSLERLVQDETGRVVGAIVLKNSKKIRVLAKRGVVLATGGFAFNEQMRNEYYPQPTQLWSMAPSSNTGDGIQNALAVGAAMGQGHTSPAFWAPVSVRQLADGSWQRFPHLVWDRAKPGLMAVNAAGQRFVNESTSYHEFVLAMYESNKVVPTVPAFLICDSPFMEKWGMGLALPGGRPRQHLVKDGYLYKAETLQELAELLQIDTEGLINSAKQFNDAARLGVDTAFAKGSTSYNRYLGDPDHGPNPCLGTLEQGPFYAVKVYPGDIGTAHGLDCNEKGQVLNAQAEPIPSLYAVGNDMQSIMGGCYPGPGITLGPALTFGWLVGRQLAQISSDSIL